VTLDHDVVLEPIGFVDRHVVTVGLTRPAVTSDLLSAPSIAQGSALSVQANQAGAVAGVNGDFFDINNSNAALGFEIQGGALRKSGDRNGGQSFGVTRDGISQLVNLALSATATRGGVERPLTGLNESAVPPGGIGAYTPAWGSYNRALLGGTAEVWIADGRVVRPCGQGGDPRSARARADRAACRDGGDPGDERVDARARRRRVARTGGWQSDRPGGRTG
jgi:hypothetical protein